MRFVEIKAQGPLFQGVIRGAALDGLSVYCENEFDWGEWADWGEKDQMMEKLKKMVNENLPEKKRLRIR